MARRNPTKMEELEQEKDELIDALQDIATLADDADDAALDRAAIIAKVREIADRVEEEIETEEEEEPAGE
ncbi:MAG: hypothetical protein ABSF71_14710 [Terriglobia bacterium]